MAGISLTYTFANGESADAGQVNTNFLDIVNGTTDGTKDFTIANLVANGSVTLGNASTDDLTVTASLASNLPIKTNNSFDIGSATIGLAGIYLGAPSSRSTRLRAHQSLSSSNTIVLPNGNGTNTYLLQTDGSGNTSWSSRTQISSATKTTTYTATAADDIILCDTSSAGWTLTLPAASGVTGKMLKIKKTSSDSNLLTVDPDGSETIDGSSSILLVTQYDLLEIMSDGTNWVIINQYGFQTPVGTIQAFGSETAPAGWLACDGSQVSRTTYAKLFSIISTNFGTGNGSTTFNVPDFRGRFLRGWDNGVGTDPDAASRTNPYGGPTGDSVGSIQSHQYQSHTHTQNAHSHTIYVGGANSIETGAATGKSQQATQGDTLNDSGTVQSTTATNQNSGGNETRPVNTYVNFIIKY